MALPSFIQNSARHGSEIKTIEMHTTGEPTRIVYSGFPDLTGTLLEQRAEAQSNYDHIRKALICEPRGHRELYGAVLRPKTELVDSGEAHMGVLFLTNEGYSTMCGHATLAVARLLVDHAGSSESSSEELLALNGERRLEPNAEGTEADVRLHVPCGLVRVIVPITSSSQPGRFHTDTTRPISYLSVPSYATGIGVTIFIPPALRWPELGDRESAVVDVAYGGAFYIIASPAALGFENSLAKPDIVGLSFATTRLKEAFNESEQLRNFYLKADGGKDLEWLYGMIITDSDLGVSEEETLGAETSLCFFSNAQIDRSPTGSGVQAKVALAYAEGRRKLGERWTYHSIVSNMYSAGRSEETIQGQMSSMDKGTESINGVSETEHSENVEKGVVVVKKSSRGEGAFVGEAVEEVSIGGKQAVTVKVSGWARYTGASTFVVEEGDRIGEGFWFDGLGNER